MLDDGIIPVLLLTGYLGSGKTTLVNKILANRRGIRFAVIVNDIGEVNIDADLIQKGGVVGQKDDSLVALQNGCICCTLKMDLVEQLNDIISMKKFDYIVIEASGICEPGPIAQTICSMPSLVPSSIRCGLPDLDCIVTVVDALRLKDEFGCGQSLTKSNIGEEDLENLVIQQIEFCNIILLNKASEVTPEELERIRQIIRAIQPKAEIIACDFCDVDLDTIINTGMFDFDKVATSAAWITEIEAQPADTYGKHEKESHHPDDHDESDHEHHHHHDHEEDEEEHGHHHHHHHHDEGEAEEYGIGTFVYCRRAPFNLGDFDEFVARKWPKNVIRAKGICYFQNEYDLCYVFEQAGRQFALSNAGRWYATMPKDELERLIEQEPGIARDWDGKYGDRMQKLVFIGQHLDKEAITEALDNCLAE
ncbi:MAG: GTP-binding protein [Bacteroidaceae bacterium]|nr:GTP-binding protein [Bacteroidaceae bacterium]